ncbi:SusC/RagA family TonB-linked outer membrane protein [Chitinophaga tropicalis]|nr:SusC/RagA family TonB-linked outer membrane protein [Chitinophaga tropicalis]
MKLTTILLLGAFIHLSAATKAQLVSYSAKSARLEKVFDVIKQQTGYVFFYDDADLKTAQPVNVQWHGTELRNALSELLRNQPFTWNIQGKTIVVTRTVSAQPIFPMEFRGKGPVTGTITSQSGQPLIGATITAKGKSVSAFTDAAGRFTINASPEDILIISHIGYARIEVQASKLTELSTGKSMTSGGGRFTRLASGDFMVELTPAVTSLDETVITGYQVLRKSSVAGSVSSIKASELYLNGINTIEQSLQGKLPGVVVTNSSGLTGVRQRTRVRGTSTLLGSQEPIWVVDGIVQEDPLPFKASTLNLLGEVSRDNFDYIRDFVGNSIGWLNPNDIEDITVLKDASATAIYGVRAANGVIVISTKKGQPGPATVNYSLNTSITEKVNYNRLEMMNSKQRVAVSKEIYERGLVSNSVNNNVGYAGALSQYLNKSITAEEFDRRVARMETVNTDWFDILFRAPVSVNHNLSISGGSGTTRYYASFGYNTANGTAKGNDSKGYSGNINITSRLSSKLNTSLRLSATNKTTNGFYIVDPYGYASKVNRALEAYTEEGALSYYINSSGFLYNFINERDNTNLRTNTLSANASMDVTYEIAPGLRFQTLFGLNSNNTVGESYATERTEYIAKIRNYDYGAAKPTDQLYINSKLPVGGEFNENNNRNLTWNWRNNLSYSRVFAQKHALTAMIGQEVSSSRAKGFSSRTLGYLHYRGKAFATLPLTYLSTNVANPLLLEMPHVYTDALVNNVGLYATANYVYDNRYALNVSVRSDASNRFGQFTGEKFNPVWAAGLRWNVAREKWFERNAWLSDLSLRSSFGYQRNIVAGVSPDLILRIPTTPASAVVDQFTGESMLTLSKLPYADLRWEKNTSVNLGIDLSLFQGRVQTTVEYYWKKGRDLITSLTVPVEYGVESMPINGGSMLNRGLDVSATFVPVRTRDFTWSVGINSSKNFNQINHTGTQITTWKTAVAGAYYKEGYPVTGFWAFDFKGVNPANGLPVIDLSVAKDADSTNDPTSYMRYMGKLDPDFTAGLGMSFRYKRFTMSTSLYLQVGGKRFLTPAYALSPLLPREYENLSTELLQRWTPANTSAKFPGLPDNRVANTVLPSGRAYNVYEMYNYSTARVVDASMLQCNSLLLAYSFPELLVKKLGCRNLSLSGGVSQLFSIVSKDFKGRDAEVATGSQPRTRSYTLSAYVSF